jgi:hypothetical protein
MESENEILIIQEGQEMVYSVNASKGIRNDTLVWVLFALFLALLVVICALATYLAVNCTLNLGSTLLSPVEFYPGQYLQNEQYWFTFRTDGILQLSSNTEGMYWESTNIYNYSTYGLVATFDSMGTLAVSNYYGQLLWSISPNETSHLAPFILNLTKEGKIRIQSVDSTTVVCFPDC